MQYIAFPLAYLLGSIPTAVWFGKLVKGIDVREHGSGNAGATNTFRVLGWKVALPVLIVDVLKGFAAVSLYNWLGLDCNNPHLVRIILGLLAVAGHIYPVFARFKGGKGVATLLGVLIAIEPQSTLLAALVFIFVFIVTHIISMSSLISAMSLPLIYFFISGDRFDRLNLGFFVFIALLLIFTHRKNIKRIFEGNESKIYFRKKNDGDEK